MKKATININIDGVIFTYEYNRSTRKYICEGVAYDSKEEMRDALYQSLRGTY